MSGRRQLSKKFSTFIHATELGGIGLGFWFFLLCLNWIMIFINGELVDFCIVSEFRCRVLDMEKKKLPPSCPWCQNRSLDGLFEIDGRISYPA